MRLLFVYPSLLVKCHLVGYCTLGGWAGLRLTPVAPLPPLRKIYTYSTWVLCLLIPSERPQSSTLRSILSDLNWRVMKLNRAEVRILLTRDSVTAVTTPIPWSARKLLIKEASLAVNNFKKICYVVLYRIRINTWMKWSRHPSSIALLSG